MVFINLIVLPFSRNRVFYFWPHRHYIIIQRNKILITDDGIFFVCVQGEAA